MAAASAIYPSLKGKTVLITGGAEGIGAAAVELFCRQGSDVVFFDISEQSSQDLIERIRGLGEADKDLKWTIPTFYKCNVLDLEQIGSTAYQVLEKYGAVDILVNNAAAAGAKSRVPSVQVTPESVDRSLTVHGTGLIRLQIVRARYKCQSQAHLLPHTSSGTRNAEAGLRQHHQHGIDLVAHTCVRCAGLHHGESGHHGLD